MSIFLFLRQVVLRAGIADDRYGGLGVDVGLDLGESARIQGLQAPSLMERIVEPKGRPQI
jgi:hypothetical protein